MIRMLFAIAIFNLLMAIAAGVGSVISALRAEMEVLYEEKRLCLSCALAKYQKLLQKIDSSHCLVL